MLFDRLRIWLGGRQTDYRLVFTGPRAEAVLADLARFCRAHETTFSADGRAQALLEGRREVWLRIQHHLQLTPDDLWKLYGRNLPDG